MEVVICKDKQEASELAARYVVKMVDNSLVTVLGLATGSTPLVVYQELIKAHQEKKVSFKSVLTFNLDEYVGVAPDHPASFRYYMEDKFFKHVDLPRENINFPDGSIEDVEKVCADYEKAIKNCGGIDLQILGVGREGHIAFNEPSSSLGSRTRLKTLTKTTIEDNKKYFTGLDSPPKHAITMGIGTIMDSKECLLLAFGEEKAPIVADFIEGPVTAMVPASILQMHKKTKVFLDEASASKLKLNAYYKEVWANKPEWQMF